MPINSDAFNSEIVRVPTSAPPIPLGKYKLKFNYYTWKPAPFNNNRQVFVAEFSVREILWGSGVLAVGDMCSWVKKISRNSILAAIEENKVLALLKTLGASGSNRPLSDFYSKEVYCIASNVKTKTGLYVLDHLWTSDRQVAVDALLEIGDSPRQLAQSAERRVEEAPRTEEPQQLRLFGPRILDVD